LLAEARPQSEFSHPNPASNPTNADQIDSVDGLFPLRLKPGGTAQDHSCFSFINIYKPENDTQFLTHLNNIKFYVPDPEKENTEAVETPIASTSP
jgi:hypothetical protein